MSRVAAIDHERLANSENADEAVSRAYESIGLRIIASLAPPQDDSPWYWNAVTTAMKLKTALCRPQMYPGPDTLDPVPIGGRYADAFLEALVMQRELLECLHDHLHHLPPTPVKAKHDRASIGRELVRLQREQEKYLGAAISGGHAMVPRARFLELDQFADVILQTLLGVMTYGRFAAAFRDAMDVLRGEYALQSGPAPAGAAN